MLLNASRIECTLEVFVLVSVDFKIRRKTSIADNNQLAFQRTHSMMRNAFTLACDVHKNVQFY